MCWQIVFRATLFHRAFPRSSLAREITLSGAMMQKLFDQIQSGVGNATRMVKPFVLSLVMFAR